MSVDTRERAQTRIDYIDLILSGRCDSVAECDCCHYDAALWLDDDTIETGEFSYCEKCWKGNRRLLKKVRGI